MVQYNRIWCQIKGGEIVDTKRVGLSLAILLIAGFTGYLILSGRFKTTTPTVTPTTTEQGITQPSPVATEAAEEDVKVVEVSGSEFKFTPAQIQVKTGQKIRVVFKNTGRIRHDFVVEGLNVRTKIISAGTTDTTEFTPDANTYTFFCSVPGHKEAGMVGKLVAQ